MSTSLLGRKQSRKETMESGQKPVAPSMNLPKASSDSEVIAALLKDGIITEAQLRRAAEQRGQDGVPPWRSLTRLPGVSQEAVFEKAAQVQGFQAADIKEDTTAEFVGAVLGLFPADFGAEVFHLNLLPIQLEQDLVIATHDPGRPEVEVLTGSLGLSVELRYAPLSAISKQIASIRKALGYGEASSAEDDAGLQAAGTRQAPAQPQAGATQPAASGDGHVGTEAADVEAAPANEEEQPPVDLSAIKTRDRVVLALLHKRLVTPQQVLEAQKEHKEGRSKSALWRVLTDVKGVDREAVYAEAARVYAFPIAKLSEGKPGAEFVRSVMNTFDDKKRDKLLQLRVLPFECEMETQLGVVKLVFITHDPTRPEVHGLMQELKLERFELQYAPESVVRAATIEAFPRKNEFLERITDDPLAFDLGTAYQEEDSQLIDEDALEAEISRSTLINLFEATLVEAVRQGASDIHIYPNAKKKVEIHLRVDGRLSKWYTEDKMHPEALTAVIKDNSTNVDRFERDMAQDGFIQRLVDETLIRFRVSILPIATAVQDVRAESIVIRVLDDRKVITDLTKIGLLESALERFDMAIRQPHGMVILTGPTGSGKSTTLVAALHQVVTPEVNVLTVEDPVEYIIPGVRQIKLSHKLDLEGALRAILRHDPDIVMVGEMRDRHTAELAIKLANTGHLTFSTLHTNDAPSAVARLYKMGVEPFLIAYAINLVVAQRLIRALCPACKQADDDPDPILLDRLGFTEAHLASTKQIYKAGDKRSCPTCKGTAYKGRRAISETLYFTREIRHLIVESDKKLDEGAIRDLAVSQGMLTLQDSARERVLMGETSVEEMMRVTASDE